MTPLKPNIGLIPKDLPAAMQGVYKTLIQISFARALDHKTPQPLIVITDLAKDYDDLLAMVLYKELHRLGLVEVRGVIANLMPAHDRAGFGRGALDALGLDSVPIAEGTRGMIGSQTHELHDYEFDCSFMATDRVNGKGENLLYQLCKEAMLKGEKFTLLCLSSLEDIAQFAAKFPNLLRRTLSDVVLQGGYFIKDGILMPDGDAQNNIFNMEAAKSFHNFLQNSRIPSMVFNKDAAFELSPPLLPELFDKMGSTGNVVGLHLVKARSRQEKVFWEAATGPPEGRFRPTFDKTHYLRRTTWWAHHDAGTKEPDHFEEVLPFCKVTAYDAMAAIGVAGDEAIKELMLISPPNPDEPISIHQIVGSTKKGQRNGTSASMSLALTALLYGSMLACEQELSSNPPK